jgi:hypothetical protein
MNSFIIAEIDTEIARLQAARQLLNEYAGTETPKRKPRPFGNATTSGFGGNRARASKRRLSPEARERIRQGQIKRWAAAKKAAESSLAKKQVTSSKSAKKSAKRDLPIQK